MPDTKITALTALTAADPANDVLPIVDVSDTTMAASGTTKKISINNVLGCSGTATLASATITGDLTVDTSTLKVDSANNRVGIGTATPGTACDVASGTVRVKNAVGDTSGLLIYQDTGDASKIFNYYNGSMQFGINNTTAMTLNSTGLGVGGSPTAKLSVVATGKGFVFGSTSAAGAYAAWQYNSADVGYVGNGTSIVAGAAATDFGLTSSAGGKLWLGSNNGASYAVLDSSGNVGIGVTPSAWSGSFKAIDIGSGCLVSQPGNQTAGIFANSFANGTNYTRKALGTAAGYDIYNGAHYWLTAASGAAGSTFAFGDAKMTLDASGNLGIGVTSPAAKLHVEGSGPQARFSVATAVDARHEYYRNGIREGLLYWDANLIGLYATQSSGELVLASANTIRVRINSAGDTISNVTATPPTLSTNRQMVFNLTSDTNLRISVRGTDGTTRTANITLA